MEFLGENEEDDTSLEVLPSAWLHASKLKAYYPPEQEKFQVKRWVMALRKPNKDTWPSFRVKFHHSYGKEGNISTFAVLQFACFLILTLFISGTYNVAMRQLKKVLDTNETAGSAVDSCAQPRKRKRPNRFQSSSSSSEDEDHPKIKKRGAKAQKLAKGDSPKLDEAACSDIKAKVEALLKSKGSQVKKPAATVAKKLFVPKSQPGQS